MYPVTITTSEELNKLVDKFQNLSVDDIDKTCRLTFFSFDLDDFLVKEELELKPMDIVDQLEENGINSLIFYDMDGEKRVLFDVENQSLLDFNDIKSETINPSCSESLSTVVVQL